MSSLLLHSRQTQTANLKLANLLNNQLGFAGINLTDKFLCSFQLFSLFNRTKIWPINKFLLSFTKDRNQETSTKMNLQAKITRPRGLLKFRNNSEPSDLSNKKLNFQLWRAKFATLNLKEFFLC